MRAVFKYPPFLLYILAIWYKIFLPNKNLVIWAVDIIKFLNVLKKMITEELLRDDIALAIENGYGWNDDDDSQEDESDNEEDNDDDENSDIDDTQENDEDDDDDSDEDDDENDY